MLEFHKFILKLSKHTYKCQEQNLDRFTYSILLSRTMRDNTKHRASPMQQQMPAKIHSVKRQHARAQKYRNANVRNKTL